MFNSKKTGVIFSYIHLRTTYTRDCINSAVCIATCYGLEGGESKPGEGEISVPIKTDPEVHPASCAIDTESFPGIKLPGRRANNPHTSSAEVTKDLEIYFCLPSVPA
jgi:hypothetical protein